LNGQKRSKMNALAIGTTPAEIWLGVGLVNGATGGRCYRFGAKAACGATRGGGYFMVQKEI
jgi:hypothetical protein